MKRRVGLHWYWDLDDMLFFVEEKKFTYDCKYKRMYYSNTYLFGCLENNSYYLTETTPKHIPPFFNLF